MAIGLRMATDAIQEIYELWQIDEDRVVWVGDETSDVFNEKLFGFDWWPGDFRFRVRAEDLGGDGVACPAYSGFIPNLLYSKMLAENLILWGTGRARWARRELWPDVEDEPLPDILNRRFGAGGHGK